MKLRVTDQLHISSVSADTLGAGAEINVSDALGQELLKKHPDKVEVVDAVESVKAEPAPANKAEQKPANKDAGGKRHSSKK
jgi:hypothetical protein